MPEELGPFITPFMIFASAFYAYALPARLWFNGHLAQLDLSGEEFVVSTWILFVTSDEEIAKQSKPYHIYLWKGIGYFFNVLWILFLLSIPGCGGWVEQSCSPIYSNIAFHNIALLDIGGTIAELMFFFIFITYFRWSVVLKKPQ